MKFRVKWTKKKINNNDNNDISTNLLTLYCKKKHLYMFYIFIDERSLVCQQIIIQFQWIVNLCDIEWSREIKYLYVLVNEIFY